MPFYPSVHPCLQFRSNGSLEELGYDVDNMKDRV